MTLDRADRLRFALEAFWFLVLAAVAALDRAVDGGRALTIVAVSAAFQVGEPLLLRPWLRARRGGDTWADVLSVAAKLALATTLVSVTGGAESRYHLIFYVPVLTAAVSFGLGGTLAVTAAASLSYSSFAYFADPDFQLPFIETGDLLLRMVFLFLVATVVNRFVGLERQRRNELAEATRALERGHRLTALGQLSSGLAHEIRNPLGIIQGSAELLRKQAETSPRAAELSEMIVSEAKRLNATLSHFLDFARPLSPRLARCDLKEPVAKAATLVAEKARIQGVRLQCDLPESPLLADADPGQVQQAVLNLGLNALAAVGGSGRVRVSAHASDGDGAVVAVEDTGAGIERALFDRIFDPFFTTRAEGTGLGLSIVHKIMEGHGGQVLVESEPGRGSTFTLRFPPARAGGGGDAGLG